MFNYLVFHNYHNECTRFTFGFNQVTFPPRDLNSYNGLHDIMYSSSTRQAKRLGRLHQQKSLSPSM